MWFSRKIILRFVGIDSRFCTKHKVLAFLGPGTEFASATFDITWTPTGKVHHFRPGSSDPTDPSDFAAEIRFATATGSFTVVQNGVTFTINNASSAGVFAEMGTERNGLFLK